MLGHFQQFNCVQMPEIRADAGRDDIPVNLPEWLVEVGFSGPFRFGTADGLQPNEEASEALRLLALEALEPEITVQA